MDYNISKQYLKHYCDMRFVAIFFDFRTVEYFDVFLTHNKFGAPKAQAKYMKKCECSKNVNMTY